MSVFNSFIERFVIKNAVSDDHARYLTKLAIKRVVVVSTQALLLLFILAIWQLAADLELINSFLTSKPSVVWATFFSLVEDGSIFVHIGWTLGEIVVGFVLGTVLGIGIAVLLWWSDFVARVLDPYLVILNSMPKVALGPIFIVWLGSNVQTVIAMALSISTIVTVTVVYSGFVQVNPNQLKLMQTFNASKRQILTKVVLPATVPTIVAALKTNAALSFVGVIVGEFLVSRAGLGYLIIYGGQVFKMNLVMLSIIILCVLSAFFYYLIAYLERRFTHGN